MTHLSTVLTEAQTRKLDAGTYQVDVMCDGANQGEYVAQDKRGRLGVGNSPRIAIERMEKP